ncbi:alpha/beta fold hydrolase [Cognatilysobacter segetis]|uniref:alpha/beta fold hydrolase n=1 Tax=Cognatilysobacter segetis TaxID=2492394 RepID=UPI00192E69D6|nr:alpha/beta fold hydrolase [Lysobacter segetis]
MSPRRFRDRDEAAQDLARALSRYGGRTPVVLAIPRGAVPMARIVADALGGELDVVLVRKLGAPGNPELAIGAVDETGHVILNDDAWRAGAHGAYTRIEAERQQSTLQERRQRYAGGRPPIDVAGRIVIVVDDGLATGATMVSALRLVRTRGPARLVCAVPVGTADALRRVGEVADEVVCLSVPQPFIAVGAHYVDFPPVSDSEVLEAIDGRASRHPGVEAVHIPAGTVELPGELTTPDAARGLVVFVHGSGSSRLSPRNRQVARVLNRAGFATLLFDLLTQAEDLRRDARFDIVRLSARLEHALDWVASRPALASMPVGLFGASTGSAVALRAAASGRHDIAAVVSRGGRPDLAGEATLMQVNTPTLLIVGSHDTDVLALNEAAAAHLSGPHRVDVIAGAGHLFEEYGTLAQAADHATGWFLQHLPAAATHAREAAQARPRRGDGTH